MTFFFYFFHLAVFVIFGSCHRIYSLKHFKRILQFVFVNSLSSIIILADFANLHPQCLKLWFSGSAALHSMIVSSTSCQEP